MFVATLRCEADRGPLPSASWLRKQHDVALVQRTVPARWAPGKRWSVELEQDKRGLRGHVPTRSVAEYHVVAVAGDEALVTATEDVTPSLDTRFIWDMRGGSLVALPGSDVLPPPTFEDAGRGWNRLVVEEPPICGFRGVPLLAPLVQRKVATGDVKDVPGELEVGRLRQRAWIQDGMVRFEVAATEPDHAILSIVWRPGEPWWAKLECYRPSSTSNPPTPSGQPWLRERDARARLVSIDGVPIEPMAWEHPPADWMDPSGR